MIIYRILQKVVKNCDGFSEIHMILLLCCNTYNHTTLYTFFSKEGSFKKHLAEMPGVFCFFGQRTQNQRVFSQWSGEHCDFWHFTSFHVTAAIGCRVWFWWDCFYTCCDRAQSTSVDAGSIPAHSVLKAADFDSVGFFVLYEEIFINRIKIDLRAKYKAEKG